MGIGHATALEAPPAGLVSRLQPGPGLGRTAASESGPCRGRGRGPTGAAGVTVSLSRPTRSMLAGQAVKIEQGGPGNAAVIGWLELDHGSSN